MIAYLRVSTQRQGASGLGLEAQREAVRAFGAPAMEFVEVESGKVRNRPELQKAIAEAKKRDCVLVVARLDRLARNAHFLLGLVESGVKVAFCDLPDLPPGPTGKFMLTMLAAVAELEGGLISDRTKKALAAARERGTELGANGKVLAERYRSDAILRARCVMPAIEAVKAAGAESLGEIADALNRRGVTSATGGKWHPTSVQRVLRRAA